MSDDIAKRLRAAGHNALMDEAAAEIERLVSICNGTVWEDNERLREENRKLRYEVNRSSYHMD